jgi:hypothetical protein
MAARGGRKTGISNYKKDVLVNVVEGILPSSAEGWKLCASRYQSASGEILIRDHSDLKRYFVSKVCNNLKKPTGEAGPDPMTSRGQRIYRQIMAKEQACSFGNNSDNDIDSEDSSSDDETMEKVNSLIPLVSFGLESTQVSPTSIPPKVGNKRQYEQSENQKSKNSRPNPRTQASSVLNRLANSVENNNQQQMMLQMFGMMSTMMTQMMSTMIAQRPMIQGSPQAVYPMNSFSPSIVPASSSSPSSTSSTSFHDDLDITRD